MVAVVSFNILKFGLQVFDALKKALHIVFIRNPLLRGVISMADYRLAE